jgi:hypothetical protein
VVGTQEHDDTLICESSRLHYFLKLLMSFLYDATIKFENTSSLHPLILTI